MLKFHIKHDIQSNKSVVKYQDQNEYDLVLEEGQDPLSVEEFLQDYLTDEKFISNYADVKIRMPKDDLGLEKITNEDYYEFIPKEGTNAEKFLLVVDRNITDYEKTTASIDDAKLTIAMNNKEEIRKARISKLKFGAGIAAVAAVGTVAATWALFYTAADGTRGPIDVLNDVLNYYGALADALSQKIGQLFTEGNLGEIVNNFIR